MSALFLLGMTIKWQFSHAQSWVTTTEKRTMTAVLVAQKIKLTSTLNLCAIEWGQLFGNLTVDFIRNLILKLLLFQIPAELKFPTRCNPIVYFNDTSATPFLIYIVVPYPWSVKSISISSIFHIINDNVWM